MNTWLTVAHVLIDPPPVDWRDRLAARLGQRPRRIGAWAELALHGALQCLDAAGEPHLPTGAQLRVTSLGGPMSATRAVAEQAGLGLPLPFTFMQSQPSQMLAALSQHLGWQGNASFVCCRDPQLTLQLAQLECSGAAAGLLFGRVEEDRRSEWWRMRLAG